MSTLATTNFKEEVTKLSEIGIPDAISDFYTSAKIISADIENYYFHQDQEGRLFSIMESFKNYFEPKGVIFCKKVQAMLYQYRGMEEKSTQKKINLYEKAHECISSAKDLATEIEYDQPSIDKRLGLIKSEWADLLHQLGDHQKANLLEIDAMKILGKLSYNHPEYPEGLLAYAIVSANKIKWNVYKVILDLDRAEVNFQNYRPRKYQIDDTEKRENLRNINLMRTKMEAIVENIKN